MTQRTTKQLKLRRGNTAEHSNFVGAVGEITVDTDLKTIRVHDGSTAGGFPLMRGDANTYTIPWTRVTNKPNLFSGNYADLTNKPTVPTALSQLTNDAGYIAEADLSNFVTSQQLSNSTAGVVQLLTNSLALKANLDQIPVVPSLGDITINGSQISAFTGVVELKGSSYAKLTGGDNYVFVNDAVGAKISLNDQEIEWTFGTNGNLTLPAGGDILNSNGQSVLGGNANTGNVTFDGIRIIGYGTASGDGAGYATLELVPDINLYDNHQYLVIDPTAPSHIHIRAGGPQDNSNADLFLGGEKSYLRVRNGSVRMQTESQQTTGYFNFNTSVGFSSAAWQDDGNGGYQIIVNDPTQDVFNAVWGLSQISYIQVYDGTNYTNVTANGNSSTPGGGPITFGVVEAPPSSPTAIVNIIIENNVTRTNSAEVNGSDFTVNVYDDVRITGSDIVSIRNRSATDPVTIITDYDNNEYTWSFNPNGTLNFPDGSTQLTAFTGVPVDTDTLDSVTDRGAITTNNITVGAVITTDITNKVTPTVGGQVTGVRYWDGAGVNLYVWLNAAATPELVTLNSFGDITGWTVSVSDGNSATVTATNPQGFFTINTDQPLTGTGTLTFTSPNYAPETSLPIDINVGTNTWTFGTDGGITFPTLTVNLHNGGNQQGQVLQFSDVSRQAIITGPTPILGQSAQRLIIQGQNGGTGEGGDVYLWAGDSDSNGGDIKIYAGDADAVPGNGGYINIDAGNGYAQGGHLSLSAGNSALYGGNVTISAGSASQGTAGEVQLSTAGGSVNLAPDGNFTISKNVVLSKPVSIVTQSVTGTVYDNQQNPFTFRILKSANPQLSAAFADPNFVLRWTGTDEGSQAAAQQAPGGMNLTSFVSDDGTYWNFNSWFGLNGFNLAGSIFTVEYGMQVNYTTISTTNTNLRLQAGNKHWTFDTLGNLELPDDGEINYSPATPSDWSGTPPTTIQEAIDRLAALVKSLNSGTGA